MSCVVLKPVKRLRIADRRKSSAVQPAFNSRPIIALHLQRNVDEIQLRRYVYRVPLCKEALQIAPCDPRCFSIDARPFFDQAGVERCTCL
jgi:hypothetical protein